MIDVRMIFIGSFKYFFFQHPSRIDLPNERLDEWSTERTNRSLRKTDGLMKHPWKMRWHEIYNETSQCILKLPYPAGSEYFPDTYYISEGTIGFFKPPKLFHCMVYLPVRTNLWNFWREPISSSIWLKPSDYKQMHSIIQYKWKV